MAHYGHDMALRRHKRSSANKKPFPPCSAYLLCKKGKVSTTQASRLHEKNEQRRSNVTRPQFFTDTAGFICVAWVQMQRVIDLFEHATQAVPIRHSHTLSSPTCNQSTDKLPALQRPAPPRHTPQGLRRRLKRVGAVRGTSSSLQHRLPKYTYENF